jgi:hypothetical protein
MGKKAKGKMGKTSTKMREREIAKERNGKMKKVIFSFAQRGFGTVPPAPRAPVKLLQKLISQHRAYDSLSINRNQYSTTQK